MRRLLSASHYKPDPSRGLEVYVDADFAGGWSSGDVHNPECVLSRTGYVLMYAGCLITWSSKLQTEIALSTTEAEYIALSQAMREALPFMNLMQEIGAVFEFHNPKPKFHCKVFEDNISCIKVAESPKFTPIGPNTSPSNTITSVNTLRMALSVFTILIPKNKLQTYLPSLLMKPYLIVCD